MELTVNLPDPLAKEARAAELLAPQAIEKLLREAIERRKQLDAFFATVERLRAANIPSMSEEGIQAGEVPARYLHHSGGAQRGAGQR